MSKRIQFEGQVHEFPDDFSDDEISQALGSVKGPDGMTSDQRTNFNKTQGILSQRQAQEPQGSAIERFASGVGSAVGGAVRGAKDLFQATQSGNLPAYTAKNVFLPAAQQASQAAQAPDVSSKVGHGMAAALPGMGPWAAGVGEQAGSGDIAGAAGQVAGMAAMIKGPQAIDAMNIPARAGEVANYWRENPSPLSTGYAHSPQAGLTRAALSQAGRAYQSLKAGVTMPRAATAAVTAETGPANQAAIDASPTYPAGDPRNSQGPNLPVRNPAWKQFTPPPSDEGLDLSRFDRPLRPNILPSGRRIPPPEARTGNAVAPPPAPSEAPTPQAPTPFKPNPRVAAKMKYGGPNTPNLPTGRNIPRKGWAGPPDAEDTTPPPSGATSQSTPPSTPSTTLPQPPTQLVPRGGTKNPPAPKAPMAPKTGSLTISDLGLSKATLDQLNASGQAPALNEALSEESVGLIKSLDKQIRAGQRARKGGVPKAKNGPPIAGLEGPKTFPARELDSFAQSQGMTAGETLLRLRQEGYDVV